MGSSPEAPNIPAAPDFKDSYIYDDEGNISGSVTKDAQGNIVYRPRELKGAELINKKVIEQRQRELLGRLYNTPEEYTRAAQEEAGAFAGEASRVARESFEKDVGRIGEVSNVRGLMGSSAWRDIMKSREKTQAEIGASIGERSTSMREGLIQAKKGQDYNLYNLYRGAGQDYSNKSMQGLQAAAGLGGQLNQFNMQQWQNQIAAANADYANRMASYGANEPWRNYIMPAASAAALAFSDRRLKKDITPLFKISDVQWYEFEYDLSQWPEGAIQPQAGKHVGVMADEVRHIPGVVQPETFHGFDMVNYDVLRRHLFMEYA